jgi:hypothetical protein
MRLYTVDRGPLCLRRPVIHPSVPATGRGIVLMAATGLSLFRLGCVILSWLALAVLGAIQGLYGRAIYANDFIAYLDVSRAIAAADWAGALNPMWSPGYPLLVALTRSLAPATAEGEWYAITLLNLVIFLATYGAWRFLIRSAIGFYHPSALGIENHPVAVWTTWWMFVGCCLALQNVSDVWPDLLVTAYFLLGTALILRLISKGRIGDGLLFGLVLGTGVWIKGALLSFAVFLFLVAILGCLTKRQRWLPLALAAVVYVPFLVLFAAGMSWSFGQFTLGATGPLNYAFHVNHLPHWYHWQGGDPFGTPVHPSPPLIPGLPVFAFAGPFHATYAPYEDIAYWYQGFHQFYSLRLQVLAFLRSSYFFVAVIRDQPILLGVLFALLVSLIRPAWRRAVFDAAWSGWPIFVPALLGLGAYFAVSIEERYLAPFALVFGLLPLAPLLETTLTARRALAVALTLIFTLAGLAQYWRFGSDTVRAAVAGADFHDAPQWRLAAALRSRGLRPGDPVAIINGLTATDRYHWAYVDHLPIVAEFGALPFRIAPREHTRFDSDETEPASQDFAKLFWQDLTDAQRSSVVEAFRAAGARAVVSLSTPVVPTDPGWTRISGTDKWLYEFPK